MLSSASNAQSPTLPAIVVTVRITPKPLNTFIAASAFGAGVDGLNQGDIAKVYTPQNLRAMKSTGFGALTYRLRTELGVEAWHWNPVGCWSEPGHKQGYWTSFPTSKRPLQVCYGCRLPRRGDTIDQANNDGYSRLNDGNRRTFWKSNPYLDQHFTGEKNAEHPQWVLINLGRAQPINAIQIDWGSIYATRYAVQYWAGQSQSADPKSIVETFHRGVWQTFPRGTVQRGHGGRVTLSLAPAPLSVRYVRLWMTANASPNAPKLGDVRDTLGYTIREIGLGTIGVHRRFRDLLRHAPSNQRQTQITVSSTDPWHRAIDLDTQVEQPGFDRVFKSGLTNGLPMLLPVGLLYDTPENAVAEVRYLKTHGCPVTHIELGEEPDGQFITPEDYGALYVQWALALHRVDPKLVLGGPSLQTTLYGCLAWPDVHGNRSWMNRFLRYLKRHNRLNEYGFFSFEWYPFDPVCAPPAPQLRLAPMLLENTLSRLHRDGVPASIPWLITEYGFSAFAGQDEMDWPGALFDAELPALFQTLGGSASYFYGYEPNVPISEVAACPTFGNLALFLSDDDRHLRQPLAAYYASRLLTRDWAQPGTNKLQSVYRANVNAQTANVPAVNDRSGGPAADRSATGKRKDASVSSARRAVGVSPARPVVHGGAYSVTAYALHRPDGLWSVLLLNKDPKRACRVRVRFVLPQGSGESTFVPPANFVQYSASEYRWHPQDETGYASPDRPPRSGLFTGQSVVLPPYSLTVLRGWVPLNFG